MNQYFDADTYLSKDLMATKLNEAVFTLLEAKPELVSVLFGFAEPWKMDLKDFMDENYMYNLSPQKWITRR